ncbi:MAG: hypothetical protein RL148_1598, partial [Planctomycetota bacterium]
MRVPTALVLAALLLGATAVAQKPGGSSSKPAPAPRPAPSVSRPAPSVSRPAPSVSRPAPAPRPVSTPSVSRPAPVSRPSVPSVSSPKPSAPSRPSYTPAPQPSQPTSRPVATPRTNTAPTVSSRPSAPVTNNPLPSKPVFGGSPTNNQGAVSRPTAPTSPSGWNTDVDATPRTGTPRTGPTFGSASRKPTGTGTATPKPVAPSVPGAVGGSTRGVGSTFDKPGLQPRNELLEMPRSKPVFDAKPRAGSSAVADRYAPKPGSVTPRSAKPGAAKPVANAKPIGTAEPIAKPVAGSRENWNTKPGTGELPAVAKPRAVERYDLDKPRLGGMPASGKPLVGSDTNGAVARPRTTGGIVTTASTESPRLVSRATGRVNTNYGGSYYGGSYYGNHGYRGYCDPYYYNPWYDRCWNYGLSFYWSAGCSTIGWGWSYPAYYSCWTPYWSWRSSCWYDGWWSSWCYPGRAYWWWPTTVYQPVYYTTPATQVIYVEQPATQYGAADYSTVEYVEPTNNAPAAVGGPVGAAPGAARPQPTPSETAAKYVRLGDFYFREGRFAEAVDAYERARKAMPDDPSLCFVQADALFATGDYHQAAFLISEALRIDPGMAR